jgi:Fic family protein
MNQDVFIEHRLSRRLVVDLENGGKIQRLISNIDSLNKEWEMISNLSPQFLENLETNTIISSTGSSTRIEGSKLTDEQVELYLRQAKIRKLETRDQQEVAGYLEMIQTVFDEYERIDFNELTIKQAHSVLLKYSQKDDKHRGAYKTQSNQVVAVDDEGKVIGIIFDPSTAEDTPNEMAELVDWTQTALKNNIIHPIIVIANFVFEFLSIHPFKDGNGRLSRILTNLLLLKKGYSYVKYISNERLIEKSKVDYYLVLRKTTNTWKTENEDLTPWLLYILDIFEKQAKMAIEQVQASKFENLLSESQLKVWHLFLERKILGRKEIAETTELPLKTVENVINKLLKLNKIQRIGEGRASKYKLL